MKLLALSILIIAISAPLAAGDDPSGGWIGKAIGFYTNESYDLARSEERGVGKECRSRW